MSYIPKKRSKANWIGHILRKDCLLIQLKRYSSPITGLERPRGFQEVKVPRFHDNGTGWW